MTTQLGFCSACGTPRLSQSQEFCGSCGAALLKAVDSKPAGHGSVVSASASPQVDQPPQAAAAPPAMSWSEPQQIATASPATARSGSIIDVLGPQKTAGVVVVIVVGAIIGVTLLLLGSTSNGISFSPSTVSCSNPIDFMTTIHLPSSVSAADTITVMLDGRTLASGSISTTATQGSDGNWTSTSVSSAAQMRSICAAGGYAGSSGVLTPGSHTEQILDTTGKILASGTYTVNP